MTKEGITVHLNDATAEIEWSVEGGRFSATLKLMFGDGDSGAELSTPLALQDLGHLSTALQKVQSDAMGMTMITDICQRLCKRYSRTPWA